MMITLETSSRANCGDKMRRRRQWASTATRMTIAWAVISDGFACEAVKVIVVAAAVRDDTLKTIQWTRRRRRRRKR